MAFDINNPFGTQNPFMFTSTTVPSPTPIVSGGQVVGYDTGYSSVPVSSVVGQQIQQQQTFQSPKPRITFTQPSMFTPPTNFIKATQMDTKTSINLPQPKIQASTETKLTPLLKSNQSEWKGVPYAYTPSTTINSNMQFQLKSDYDKRQQEIKSKQIENVVTSAEREFITQSNIAGQDAVREVFIKPTQMDTGVIPRSAQPFLVNQFTFKDGKIVDTGKKINQLDIKRAEIATAPARVADAKQILDEFGIETKSIAFGAGDKSKLYQETIESSPEKIKTKELITSAYQQAQNLKGEDVIFIGNLTQAVQRDMLNNNNTYSKQTLDLLEKNATKYNLMFVGLTPAETLKTLTPGIPKSLVSEPPKTAGEAIHQWGEAFYKTDTDAEVKKASENVGNIFGPVGKDVSKAVFGTAVGLPLSFIRGGVGAVHDFAWKDPINEPAVPVTKIPETEAKEKIVEANKTNISAIKKFVTEVDPVIKGAEDKYNKSLEPYTAIEPAAKVFTEKYEQKYTDLYNKNKQYLVTKIDPETKKEVSEFVFDNDEAFNRYNQEKEALNNQFYGETQTNINDVYDYIDFRYTKNQEFFGKGTKYDEVFSKNYREEITPEGTSQYIYKDFENVNTAFKSAMDAYKKDEDLMGYSAKSELKKISDFSTRRALEEYGLTEPKSKIFGVSDRASFIDPGIYSLSKDVYSKTTMTPKEIEAKYVKENPLAGIMPFIGPESNVRIVKSIGGGIGQGIERGATSQYEITDSLIPGFDKPIDLEIGGLKIGETPFRMGSMAVGGTLAGTGEEYFEGISRDYYKGMDKQYDLNAFEKLKEGDIQAAGQTGRLVGSLAAYGVSAVTRNPYIAFAASIPGAGESKTSEELMGSLITGGAFAAAGGGVRAFGEYSRAASKFGTASKILGFAEKVALPTYFGVSSVIEGSKAIELARKGKEFEAEEMDRGLRAMLGGATIGAIGPGAIAANLIEIGGGAITAKKYPEAFRPLNPFVPKSNKSSFKNIFDMIKSDGTLGNKFSTVLKYGKEKVKMFFYNDVGVKGKWKEKYPGLKEITEDQYFSSISRGPDIGKPEYISTQQTAGAAVNRVKEGLLDKFFGTGQRYPVRYFENTTTGEKFGIAYTGYATGRTSYSDTRGILDVLAGQKTGIRKVDKSSKLKQVVGVDKTVKTFSDFKEAFGQSYVGRIIGGVTKVDLLTPSKLNEMLFSQDTYLEYSKGQIAKVPPLKSEVVIINNVRYIKLREYLSRIKNDPSLAGKQIINPAEMPYITADGKIGGVFNETATILISQGRDPVTGKFILGSKVTELPGQRVRIQLKDTGRISTMPLQRKVSPMKQVVDIKTSSAGKSPKIIKYKSANNVDTVLSNKSISELGQLADSSGLKRKIKVAGIDFEIGAKTTVGNVIVGAENIGIGIKNVAAKTKTLVQNIPHIESVKVYPQNISKNIVTGIKNVAQPNVYIDRIGRIAGEIGLTTRPVYLTTKPVVTSAATWEDTAKYKGKTFTEAMKKLNEKINVDIKAKAAEKMEIVKLRAKLKQDYSIVLTPEEIAIKVKLNKMTPKELLVYKPTTQEARLIDNALQKRLRQEMKPDAFTSQELALKEKLMGKTPAELATYKLTPSEIKLMESALRKELTLNMIKGDSTLTLTPREQVLMQKILQQDLDTSLTTRAIENALTKPEPVLTNLQKAKIPEILAKDLYDATRYNQLRRDVARRIKDPTLLGTDMAYTPAEAKTMEYFIKQDIKGEALKTRTGRAQARRVVSTKLKTGDIYDMTPSQRETVKYFLEKDATAAKAAKTIEAKLASEGITGYQKGTTYLRDAGRAIIYDKKGNILLVKDAKTGKWDLPGGGRARGESIDVTVAREIFEETGLTPDFKKVPGKDFIGGQFRDYKGRGYVQNRNILFEGKAIGNINLRKGEISGARYFTPNQVIEKTNAGRTTKRTIAREQGYSDQIFALDPKISPYKIKPWDNLEYQQNLKVTVPKEGSIPKWNSSLVKSFVYGSVPKDLTSDVINQISFSKSSPLKETKLTSSAKQQRSDVISQLSIPASSVNVSSYINSYYNSSSPSSSPTSSSISSSESSSNSELSSSSLSSRSSPSSYSPFLYSPTPPKMGGDSRGRTGKRGMGKAPGKKQLIQVKSSLFRKFAFGEKDFTIDAESYAAFKDTIARKGTFFGYDAIPTEEQRRRAEAKLLQSNAETKGLKAEKSIFNIRV